MRVHANMLPAMITADQFLSSGVEALNMVHLKSRVLTEVIGHGLLRLETALKPSLDRLAYNDTPAFSQDCIAESKDMKGEVLSDGQSEIGVTSGIMSDFFSTDRNIFRS